MALVQTTLNCTGTSSTTVRKLPSKTQTVVSSLVTSLLKGPRRIVTGIAVSNIIISLLRLGIDTFDIIEIGRKWFVDEIGRWGVKIEKRFGFLVRGRPSG